MHKPRLLRHRMHQYERHCSAGDSMDKAVIKQFIVLKSDIASLQTNASIGTIGIEHSHLRTLLCATGLILFDANTFLHNVHMLNKISNINHQLDILGERGQRYMIPAKLLSYGGGSAKFELEDGQELIQRVNTDITLDPLDPQCLDSNISNLIELKALSEKAVLHVLRIRFAKDEIYTLVSGILIACNPFKSMPIYDMETMDTYRRTRDHSTLSPHIFSLANEAYVSMVQTGTPQSIVISGESGAGKTESIKLILKYLARLSEITSSSSKSVQDQILSANPVLEAFGNAKTSRNNNSSRFGKLITVNFSGGVINQASIISYLLEKSRVVHQQAGERNFHVFYQLLAACTADPKLGFATGLQQSTCTSMDECTYLSDPTSSYLYNTDEAQAFTDVDTSLEVLGMHREQRDLIFQVVACVLRLGNLHFHAAESCDTRALIDDIPELDRICDTLGLKHSEMKRLLVSRNFGVRSIVTCFFSVQQAKETRDAFSKALYSHLFSWLIKMTNLSLSHGNNEASTATGQFIALLDIFGFENFENNSFEQLLINYCNEKLQFHFNSHIFVMEQEAYKLEGIDIDYVNFKDNSPTLAVIEMKGTGVLSMIDEEINIPKGSDMSFLNKIMNSQDKKAFIGRAKPVVRTKGKANQGSSSASASSPNHLSSFSMKHYAGEVAYDVTGFLEKNKDTLSPDLTYLGKNSSVPFVSEIFRDSELRKGSAPSTSQRTVSKRSTAKAKGPTIATQFKKQLTDLITTLNSTSSFFVRCMKTNPQKAGGVYDCNLMLKQLQYSGLLEVCRIRQEGYPCRHDFQGFHCMYRKLNPSSSTGPLLAKDLETKGLYGPTDYRIGRNKIFLKYAAGQKLEQLRGDSIITAANTCQSAAKVFMAKRRLKRLLQACHHLHTAAESRDIAVLEAALALLKKHLPNEGEHLPAVRVAKTTLQRIRDEEPLLLHMSAALDKKDFSAIEVALAQARSITPPLSSPLIAACEQAIKDYLKARMDAMKASPIGMTSAKQSAKPESKTESNATKKSNSPCDGTGTPEETPSMTTSRHAGTGNKHSTSSKHVPFAAQHSSTKAGVSKGPTGTAKGAATGTGTGNDYSGSAWGSPSAIRAANGKIATSTSTSGYCAPPAPGPRSGSGPASVLGSKVTPKVKKQSVSSSSRSTTVDTSSSSTNSTNRLSDSDHIVEPAEDFKSKKRSILKRQLSSEQIGVAEEVSQTIETLHDLCMCEVGINPDDIKPLEVMLKKINLRDCSVNREVAEMMMAEQELIRAKKQLLLQTAVDKVKPNTPLWKLKNLAAQSRQLGMENYHGCRNLAKIIEAAS